MQYILKYAIPYLPYQAKMQYLQILNIIDTSIKQENFRSLYSSGKSLNGQAQRDLSRV